MKAASGFRSAPGSKGREALGTAGPRALAATVAIALAAGCAATRPTAPGDICRVFGEQPEWYSAARRSEARWGVPVPVQLAVIAHESGFRDDARPPRGSLLWILPGPRPSSAYGYGQVLDGTWDHYRESTGRSGADRDDFSDVTDFIGWYGETGRRFGVPKDDPYRFYLAYHEGHGGYARGSHRKKPDVQSAARAVADRAHRYERQLSACREQLEQKPSSWWWPFS